MKEQESGIQTKIIICKSQVEYLKFSCARSKLKVFTTNSYTHIKTQNLPQTINCFVSTLNHLNKPRAFLSFHIHIYLYILYFLLVCFFLYAILFHCLVSRMSVCREFEYDKKHLHLIYHTYKAIMQRTQTHACARMHTHTHYIPVHTYRHCEIKLQAETSGGLCDGPMASLDIMLPQTHRSYIHILHTRALHTYINTHALPVAPTHTHPTHTCSINTFGHSFVPVQKHTESGSPAQAGHAYVCVLVCATACESCVQLETKQINVEVL